MKISLRLSIRYVIIWKGDIMLGILYPYEYAPDVFSINYKKLYKMGYRGLIFDIDNTLVHHGDGSTEETDRLFRFIQNIGFKTLLLTNNDEERVKLFIRNIDTDYICDAGKPDPDAYKKALRKLDLKRNQAVVIGDQIFIDILGANSCGIPSILVHYITLPTEKKIGKRRYLEKAVLFFYRKNKKYRHRFGNILKKGN